MKNNGIETNKAIKEGFEYLLTKFFDGNVSEMSRSTGVDRGVITQIYQGEKDAVNSTTLKRLFDYGICINWLLSGEGKPFRTIKTKNSELAKKEEWHNKMSVIQKAADEIEHEINKNPELKMDPDVQIALLQLIQKAIRC